MKDKFKIMLGAVVIAVVACLSYYGLFLLLSFIKPPEMPDIVVLILGMGIIVLLPVIGVIIRVFLCYWCQKRLQLSSFQSKVMLLVSSFLYGFGIYYGILPYGERLSFEEGLGFVLGIFLAWGVTALEILLLIVLLVIERKVDVGKRVEEVKERVNS